MDPPTVAKQYELEEANKVLSISPNLGHDDEIFDESIDSCHEISSNHGDEILDGSSHHQATTTSYLIFIPFLLSLMALVCTGAGSWSCHYFNGATIVFTSARYGLWTLEDASGKCQLWDQLFFSFYLGAPLRTARFFSMVAQLDGLAVTTVMIQALQFHVGSWSILVTFTALFLASMFSSVHRRMTKRGCKIISGNCALCSLFSFLTLIVLKSEYCTCNNITSEQLEGGRDLGQPCEGSCTLDIAGGIMIFAGFLWGITSIAVLKIGIQPDTIRQNESDLLSYANYPRQSIVTRFTQTVKGVARVIQSPFATNSAGFTVPDNAANEDTDFRSRCQKICCDYRVTSRNWKERVLFWSFRLLLGILVTLYIIIVVLKVNSFYENLDASIAPETSHLFTLDDVCAFNPNNTAEPFKSYPTKDDAVREGYKVAHCGECAQCSNPWDIKKYVETRKTIAMKAKKCALYAVFGTDYELTDCLKEKIGFSHSCTECWTENMINTATFCLFTCAKATLTGFARANNVRGTGNSTVWMNQCIYCDEKMSGPEFVTCSGVARRRLGVQSEIERNPKEQCKNTDVDWVNVNFNDMFPKIRDPNSAT